MPPVRKRRKRQTDPAAAREGAPTIRKAGSRDKAVATVFGPPGCGKTSLVGDDPAVKTLLVRPYTSSMPVAVKNVADELVVSGRNELTDAFTHLQQGVAAEYDWVWLEDAALMQDVLMDDVFATAVARSPHRAEFGWDKQEYGLQQGTFSKFCRDMVGLATDGVVNFGIIAHTMEWDDPTDDVTKWAPHIEGGQGKFMNRIMGMCQVIAYYGEVEDKKGAVRRVLRTGSYGDLKILTKDQLNLGGERRRLVDPTMGEMHARMAGTTTNNNKRPAKRRRRRTSK